MAFRHGKSGVFKLGTAAVPATPTDISSYCEEVNFPRKSDTAETTTFGATAKTFVMGLSEGTFSVKGKWDATQDAQMAALVGFDTALAFEHGPEGSTAGRIKYTGNCFVTEYQSSTPVGDVVSWSASLQITGAVTRTTY